MDPPGLIRSACAAVGAFKADALIALCTPDVEFSSAITSADTVRYRGADGIREYIANLASTFEWVELWPTAATGVEDRWVATVSFRARGQASGVEVEQRFYQAVLFRDGRACWWAFYDSISGALAAAGLDPARTRDCSSHQPLSAGEEIS